MSSSNDHTEEKENNKCQEAQELFDSFMEIAKYAETQEEKSNEVKIGTNDKTTLKECISSTGIKPESGSERGYTNKEISSLSPGKNNNETSIYEGDDSSLNKGLSKAVDELSDLEKQLSLMISGDPSKDKDTIISSKILPPDSDSHPEVGIEHNASHDINIATVTIPCDTVSNVDDRNCNKSEVQAETKSIKLFEENKEAADKEVSNIETTPNADRSYNLNNDIKEEDQNPPQFIITYKEMDADNKFKDVTPQLEPQFSENDCSSLSKEDDEEIENKNNDTQFKQAAVNKTMDRTIDSSTDILKKCDQDVSSFGLSSETIVQQSKTAGLGDNGTDLSASEIEIVMTDESGIAERKSLDSLDTDHDDLLHSDSPALSDEGIDSDIKSLDDLIEDDTFDSGSMSDLTAGNTAKLLSVDRNRMGSDSSTVSEREFKTSMSHNSDAEESDKAEIKGYLLKLGGSGLTPKNWRKRWFVLKEDNCLYYYKYSKDKVPCGVIVLCNYSVSKAPDSNKKFCFKLNKGGARTYHFCASNDDEMRNWMMALMKAAAIESASGTSFQILEGNVHNVSIPALSIKDPECHGYLFKKGQNIKSWKRRYCVLKNGYLYYYSDMSNTTALGVVKLIGYEIKCGETRGKHFSFYGNPPEESMRIYHFFAETENDRERWMSRMQESIGKGTLS